MGETGSHIAPGGSRGLSSACAAAMARRMSVFEIGNGLTATTISIESDGLASRPQDATNASRVSSSLIRASSRSGFIGAA